MMMIVIVLYFMTQLASQQRETFGLSSVRCRRRQSNANLPLLILAIYFAPLSDSIQFSSVQSNSIQFNSIEHDII